MTNCVYAAILDGNGVADQACVYVRTCVVLCHVRSEVVLLMDETIDVGRILTHSGKVCGK